MSDADLLNHFVRINGYTNDYQKTLKPLYEAVDPVARTAVPTVDEIVDFTNYLPKNACDQGKTLKYKYKKGSFPEADLIRRLVVGMPMIVGILASDNNE